MFCTGFSLFEGEIRQRKMIYFCESSKKDERKSPYFGIKLSIRDYQIETTRQMQKWDAKVGLVQKWAFGIMLMQKWDAKVGHMQKWDAKVGCKSGRHSFIVFYQKFLDMFSNFTHKRQFKVNL